MDLLRSMNHAQDHVIQARHNEEFLAEIDHAKFPDWAITACFYSAVHWVEAAIRVAEHLKIKRRDGMIVRIKQPISTDDLKSEIGETSPHRVRKHLLLSNPAYFKCSRPYNSLMEDSHTSRYTCYRRIPSERVALCLGYLAAVKVGLDDCLTGAPSEKKA